MDKQYIECKPVMLPGDGPFFKESSTQHLVYKLFSTGVAQHLYLVSHEEIKEGDLFRNASSIVRCIRREVYRPTTVQKPVNSLYDDQGREWFSDDSKKIESATDKSLGLPLIPQSFIEEYVQEQGKIDKVRVAITGYINSTTWEHDEPEFWGPKIHMGEVIILPIEDKISLDDVMKWFNVFINTFGPIGNSEKTIAKDIAEAMYYKFLKDKSIEDKKMYSREEVEQIVEDFSSARTMAEENGDRVFVSEWFDKTYPI